jgi:hypothetical protein
MLQKETPLFYRRLFAAQPRCGTCINAIPSPIRGCKSRSTIQLGFKRPRRCHASFLGLAGGGCLPDFGLFLQGFVCLLQIAQKPLELSLGHARACDRMRGVSNVATHCPPARCLARSATPVLHRGGHFPALLSPEAARARAAQS